jgi:hypothetical protein
LIEWGLSHFQQYFSYIVAVWRIENWPKLIYPKQVYHTLYLAIFLLEKEKNCPQIYIIVS